MTSADEPVLLPGGGRSAGTWAARSRSSAREHLPPLADRARQLAAIVDGYGLTARQRRGFLNQVIEFAICDTAWEADDAGITPETTADLVALWAMAWRARSAAWMIRHRRTLESALTRGAT